MAINEPAMTSTDLNWRMQSTVISGNQRTCGKGSSVRGCESTAATIAFSFGGD